jgi:ankyrin repeat protein
MNKKTTQSWYIAELKILLSAVFILSTIEQGNSMWASEMYDAIQSGDNAKIESLINLGVNINATSKYGYTPLYEAVMSGNRNTIEFLITHGAEINAVGGYRKSTPLHEAVRSKDKDMVKFLVEDCHADVTVVDIDGQTPLHLAVRLGKKDIVEFLVEDCHANINARTNENKTPMDLAVRSGNRDIIEFLKNHDAEKLYDNQVWKLGDLTRLRDSSMKAGKQTQTVKSRLGHVFTVSRPFHKNNRKCKQSVI